MAALDLAGVIGTWVAVALALIALLGIIGPILVIRAARGKRHKAIAAIGMKNNGYITKGFPVWPRVRFFQRVRAPKLHKIRDFTVTEWGSFDIGRKKAAADSPATWVQFGACLQAYNVFYETGETFLIRDGKTTLPVHKIFLKLFCTVGRFSEQRIRRPTASRNSPLKKGRRETSVTPQRDILDLDHSEERPQLREYDERMRGQLHGLSGVLEFYSAVSSFTGDSSQYERSVKVLFRTDLEDSPPTIEPEKLSILSLVLLLDGFLPFSDKTYLNVLDPDVDSDVDSSVSVEITPQLRTTFTKEAMRRKSPARRMDSPYFIESSTPGRARFAEKQAVTYAYKDQRPQALEFEEVLWEDEALDHLSIDQETKYFTLRNIKLDSKTEQDLRNFSGMTFVPAAEPWIRVDQTFGEDCYMRREDAQRLAFALLNMAWHPQSYLLDGVRAGSQVLKLLMSASPQATSFLGRVKDGVHNIGLDMLERNKFIAVADPILKKTLSSAALYDLDVVLSELEHESAQTNHMIGVLTLTNEEFRGLVYRSTHYLDMSSRSQIEVDLRSGRVTVPSAFNVSQAFEVDAHILAPKGSQNRDVVSINHTVVLIAALRACIRSQMLKTCIDASAMKRLVDDTEEKVFLIA